MGEFGRGYSGNDEPTNDTEDVTGVYKKFGVPDAKTVEKEVKKGIGDKMELTGFYYSGKNFVFNLRDAGTNQEIKFSFLPDAPAGRGGFGEVFFAREIGGDRTIVIKKINKNVFGKEDGQIWFNQEVDALEKCDGIEGIPKLYGSFTLDAENKRTAETGKNPETFFIMMEDAGGDFEKKIGLERRNDFLEGKTSKDIIM